MLRGERDGPRLEADRRSAADDAADPGQVDHQRIVEPVVPDGHRRAPVTDGTGAEGRGQLAGRADGKSLADAVGCCWR